MNKALIIAAVIALASTPAQAVIIDGRLEVVITEVDTFTYALGGTVTAFQINLKAINVDDTIFAFDVDIIGDLYQLALLTDPPPFPPGQPPTVNSTPTLVKANTWLFFADSVAIDSHFLLDDTPTTGDLNTIVAPLVEDNDLRYGENIHTTTEGLGTSLSGIASLFPASTQQDLPFAYVVVPSGGSALLTGACANGIGDEFFFGEKGVSGIDIPEPATLILFGAAVPFLLKSRRKSR